MARKKPARAQAPEVCPMCGEDVPRGALACPECGADHETGWKPDADSIGADSGDDEEFNYEEYLEKEFGHSPVPVGTRKVWWFTAIALLVITLLMYLLVRF